MVVRFDDSLPQLAAIVARLFDGALLSDAAFVRDVGGRLSVALPRQIEPLKLDAAETEIRTVLGGYARPDWVIRDSESLGAQRLLREASELPPIAVGEFKIRLLDRRIVGSDWLKPPTASAAGIPRVTVTSLKGGVGRSTALCVLAAYLSRKGRRVLAIDFDLEAPGIGTMLLRERELPPYGTLDFLVENSVSGIDELFMADLVGNSTLGSEGARVAVVPAIGRRTIEYPSGALAKIARAYLENPKDDGPPTTLSDHFREMLERFEETGAYDIILIDARAGLHETAASAILSVGGDVLLFGIDQPQTFLGYKLLFSHLARFPIDNEDDWRDRLRFVHGKAPESPKALSDASERFLALYEIIAPPPVETQTDTTPLTADDFELEWSNESEGALPAEFTPPAVLHIFDDNRYRDFDPMQDESLLDLPTYTSSFASILEYADALLNDNGPPGP
jgi:hypothetical protein